MDNINISERKPFLTLQIEKVDTVDQRIVELFESRGAGALLTEVIGSKIQTVACPELAHLFLKKEQANFIRSGASVNDNEFVLEEPLFYKIINNQGKSR